MADLLLRDIDPDEFRRSIVEELTAEIRKIADAQNGPRLADRPEMAERASIGISTLDDLAAAEKIPSVMVGRRRLFEPAKVIAALAGNA